MTDEQFKAELWIRAYTNQIDGYPLGHPGRVGFQPIVVMTRDRKETLDLPCYVGFTVEEKQKLLDRG